MPERVTRYERIVAARNAGGTWADIAAEFGISVTACRGIYSRSRTPERLRAWRDKEKERSRGGHKGRQADILKAKAERQTAAVRLREMGMLAMEIASTLEVGLTTVYKYLREART